MSVSSTSWKSIGFTNALARSVGVFTQVASKHATRARESLRRRIWFARNVLERWMSVQSIEIKEFWLKNASFAVTSHLMRAGQNRLNSAKNITISWTDNQEIMLSFLMWYPAKEETSVKSLKVIIPKTSMAISTRFASFA